MYCSSTPKSNRYVFPVAFRVIYPSILFLCACSPLLYICPFKTNMVVVITCNNPCILLTIHCVDNITTKASVCIPVVPFWQIPLTCMTPHCCATLVWVKLVRLSENVTPLLQAWTSSVHLKHVTLVCITQVCCHCWTNQSAGLSGQTEVCQAERKSVCECVLWIVVWYQYTWMKRTVASGPNYAGPERSENDRIKSDDSIFIFRYNIKKYSDLLWIILLSSVLINYESVRSL